MSGLLVSLLYLFKRFQKFLGPLTCRVYDTLMLACEYGVGLDVDIFFLLSNEVCSVLLEIMELFLSCVAEVFGGGVFSRFVFG